MLANRLKQVLPAIISPTQIAFVPSRLIIDNILVAYETLHTMHVRKKGKKGLIALKLDISKAYDHIEWPFLQGMMQMMGFPDRWIGWVMGSLFSLMVSLMGIPTPLEVFIKVTPYHHICSSYV